MLNSGGKAIAASMGRKRRKTGGGRSDDEDVDEVRDQVIELNEITRKIIKLISPIAIHGVSDGFDSCDSPPPPPEDSGIVLEINTDGVK